MKWIGRRGTTEHPGLTAATSGQCDPYIDGHAERVEEYTRLILETLRVRGQQAEQIVTAARLHEIGKTEQALASMVLRTEDRAGCQMSPEREGELVAAHSELSNIAEMVRHHHEAWDGSGYPAALEGGAIPFGARVIAVADAFDAMTHVYPDRPSLPTERALEILRHGKGRQWDPEIVDAFISSMDMGRERQEAAHIPRLMDSVLPSVVQVPA